jgi:hypothetical protein
MLNEPAYNASADVDVYDAAIRTGRGEMGDARDEAAEKTFAAYTQQGMVRFQTRSRKDLATTYERWLHTSTRHS